MSETTNEPVDTAPPIEPVTADPAPAPAVNDTDKPVDGEPDWVKFRHQRERAKRERAERERDDYKAQVEAFRRTQGVGSAGTQQDNREGGAAETPQQVEARVRADMAVQERAREFNRKADAIALGMQGSGLSVETAMKGFGDVGLDFQNKEHREFVEDIADLPNSAQVFYALGTNRDEAARLLELSPRAQARELKALSDRLSGSVAQQEPVVTVGTTAPSPPKPVSAAPRPPGQVARGQPSSTKVPDGENMEEYVAFRRKQESERKGR